MYKAYETGFRNQTLSFRERFWGISFSYVLLIVILAAIGVVMLYSAANGNWQPWASRQLMRFGLGFGVMLVVAFMDVRIFYDMRICFILACWHC